MSEEVEEPNGLLPEPRTGAERYLSERERNDPVYAATLRRNRSEGARRGHETRRRQKSELEEATEKDTKRTPRPYRRRVPSIPGPVYHQLDPGRIVTHPFPIFGKDGKDETTLAYLQLPVNICRADVERLCRFVHALCLDGEDPNA